jgi:acyl carrier protein
VRSVVEAAVVPFLAERAQALSCPLTGETLVFDAGLLDSVSLLELVAVVEQASGQTVDMLRFDPSAVETMPELVNELSAALLGSPATR